MHYELKLFEFFSVLTRQETSIEELARIWQCSTRYAKTIVQKLHKKNIIKWETAKGRGKKPYITLLNSKDECIFNLFTYYWEKNQFDLAYSLLGEHQMLNEPKIQEWLQLQYGVHKKDNAKHIFCFPLHDEASNITFNPLHAISNYDAHFIKQVHETLFKENEQTGEIEGNLLFHYESLDYRKWRFILRKGIYFHNLKLVHAEDVLYSLERLVELAKPYFDFEKIEIIHDYELVLTLSNPFALLPHLLTSFRTVILPKEHADGFIGCGAFMLEKQSKQRLQLKTFDHYFNTRPYIDGIDVIFANNGIDLGISYLPYPKSIAQRTVLIQDVGADYVVLNCKTGPLQQEEMRETIYALIHADDFVSIDQQEIVATGWLPNSKPLGNNATIKCAGISFPNLTIGFQQIHPGVNHFNKALILQKQLKEHGILSTLQCIDLQQSSELDDSIDIFIGGAIIGRQKVISILNKFFTRPKAILSLLDNHNKQIILNKLETIYSGRLTYSYEQVFQDIEQHLQKMYCMKFLTQHQHHLYIREDFNYQNLQFDEKGFIRYKQIYV